MPLNPLDKELPCLVPLPSCSAVVVEVVVLAKVQTTFFTMFDYEIVYDYL